jgi:aryl-alcohol dehydrogenase-like predicted oxidoreductase
MTQLCCLTGILSDRWLGKGAPSQEDRNTASMRMYSSTASRFGDWSLVQELLRTMDAVAKNVRADGRCEKANISNIAQRYVLDTPAVASVLIGVRNTDHLEENVRTHSFQLKQEERDAIDAVVAKRKGPTGDVWDIERGSM